MARGVLGGMCALALLLGGQVPALATGGVLGHGAVATSAASPASASVPPAAAMPTSAAVPGTGVAPPESAVEPEPAPEESAPGTAPDGGPAAGPGQWFIEDYGIDELWEQTTGDGVSVAVIDSGVDDGHENLTDTVRDARDFSGSGTDGRTPIGPEANQHHGTAVAGVIAGNGSGAGPTGVAPDAEILSASMWLGSGLPEGAKSSREQAVDAIRWAVDSGASVINMSLGWDDPAWPESWDEVFAYAYSKDVVIVACVGNSSQGATQAWSPSTVPGVVGVGGLGQDGQVRHPSTAPGTAVDVMGPAEEIPVPFHTGGYAQAAGCSFAAPVVSGVVALLRSAHPELSADEVVAALESTATAVPGHDGRSTPESPDPVIGWGRIQPVSAFEAGPPAAVPVAAEDLASWVHMHRQAPGEDEADTADPALPPESQAASEPGGAQPATRAPVLGPVVLIGGALAALVLAALALVRARRAALATAPAEPDAPLGETRGEAGEPPGDSADEQGETPDRAPAEARAEESGETRGEEPGDRPAERPGDGPGNGPGQGRGTR